MGWVVDFLRSSNSLNSSTNNLRKFSISLSSSSPSSNNLLLFRLLQRNLPPAALTSRRFKRRSAWYPKINVYDPIPIFHQVYKLTVSLRFDRECSCRSFS
jgi:hypothetical protein